MSAGSTKKRLQKAWNETAERFRDLAITVNLDDDSDNWRVYIGPGYIGEFALRSDAELFAHTYTDLQLLLDVAEAAGRARTDRLLFCTFPTSTMTDDAGHVAEVGCGECADCELLDALDALEAAE